MIGFLFGMFGLAILMLLFGIAFKLTGALLAALFWVCIKVPLALILWSIGIVCCCTLLLIPVGIGCFKVGLRLLIPG